MKLKKELTSDSPIESQPVLEKNNNTDGQNEVLKLLLQWVKNKDRVYTLTGSAGTGKTTITKQFITKCGIPKRKIVVSAPTHKAKKVISKTTELKGETLQSLLGLRPNTELKDFNVNNPQFDVLADEQINKYELVIVDECSMINTNLFNHLIDTAGKFNVKILFIGDAMQLPPVNEKLSQAFKIEKTNQYKLTQIVRQADDNPLLELLNILRNDIKFNTLEFIKVLNDSQMKINSKDEGFVVVRNIQIFQDYLVNEFKSKEFINDKEYIKYTAWTNKNLTSWNIYIRNQVHNTPIEKIVLGDLLMAYKTTMDEFKKPVLVNSEEYVVTDLFEVTTPNHLKCWRVTLNSTSVNRVTKVTIVKPESYQNFMVVHNNLLETATNYRGQHWAKYYRFKNSHLLLDSMFDKQGRIIVSKDLDYGYGCTVHKTQGSTYDYVAINGKNLNKNLNEYDMRKLWYVALSRASKKCIILL